MSVTAAIKDVELPQELLDYVNDWKEAPGNLIMILHRTQKIYSYIPREVAFKLAKILDVPLAKIYGVITFYHYFKLEKPGRNRISVCMGTACYLKGGQELVDELGNILGIGINEVSDDGEFSYESVRCVGCCGLAPVLMVNDDVYGKVTAKMLPEIISKHKNS